MEVRPGVFVSSLSTDGWEPDHEVGGEMHVLCATDGIEAGLSRFVAGSDPVVKWTLPGRETVLVLEGAARIEIDGGPTLDLKGRRHRLTSQGAHTNWSLTLPFKEGH